MSLWSKGALAVSKEHRSTVSPSGPPPFLRRQLGSYQVLRSRPLQLCPDSVNCNDSISEVCTPLALCKSAHLCKPPPPTPRTLEKWSSSLPSVPSNFYFLPLWAVCGIMKKGLLVPSTNPKVYPFCNKLEDFFPSEVYVHTILCFYISGHLACFHPLAIVNIASKS